MFLSEAYVSAVGPSNILARFRSCGIHPYSPDHCFGVPESS